MATKYTVSVNHGEYMEGFFDTESQAEDRIVKLLVKDYVGTVEEMEEAKETGELWELGDGYGLYVKEIYGV